MNTNPSPLATARRNLAERIERFLREQLAMPAPTISGWQADQVFMAIELLDTADFAGGERVMMQAEKAEVFEPAGYVAAVDHGARELLGRLERALAAG